MASSMVSSPRSSFTTFSEKPRATSHPDHVDDISPRILPPPQCWFDNTGLGSEIRPCESSSDDDDDLGSDEEGLTSPRKEQITKSFASVPVGESDTFIDEKRLSSIPHTVAVEQSQLPSHSTPSSSPAINSGFSETQNSFQRQNIPQSIHSASHLSPHRSYPVSHKHLSKLVGSPMPSPSWKEISSEVLPAAARELLSTSMHKVYHTARLTYSQAKWTQRYSDYGNNATGYFKNNNNSQQQTTPKNSSATPQSMVNLEDLPAFSSLSWVDRQMVKEWRTYFPEQRNNNENLTRKNTDIADMCQDEDAEDLDFDQARTLVPAPLSRPVWQKADVCFACHKTFGPTLLRHHCRLCGKSVCHADSRHTRRLPHLGYHPDVPERVCDGCAAALWDQNLAERIAWRLARCRDFHNGTLSPYFEIGIDSVEQKAMRITHAAIAMAKSIPLGAQATVAVETVDVLRKYGLSGIYSIMLRHEFLAAADLLQKALGINRTAWPLSVHELSAAIFYALAQHRAMRGMNPEREHEIHAFRNCNKEGKHENKQIYGAKMPKEMISDGKKTSDDSHSIYASGEAEIAKFAGPGNADSNGTDEGNEPLTSASFTPVCDPVPNKTLSSLIFYAPIALNFIYVEKEVDMQLLAAQQGWRLIYAYLNSEKDGGYTKVSSSHLRSGHGQHHHAVHDRPASALFVHEEQKIACIAVRGTSTMHDVITDIRQVPVPFPEAITAKEKEDEDWIPVSSRGHGVAVAGMASAAFNLYREHIDALLQFAQQGYRIRMTGHSLGGAVASLLGALVYRDLNHLAQHNNLSDVPVAATYDEDELKAPLRVYAYGTPSCVDANLSDIVESFVVTAVLHDDVVPRLSPTTCRGLLKHLLHIRETWVKTHFSDDIKAFTERAKTVWAPKWRGGFTLPNASSSVILKRYCKKQIQYGKRTLLSVKEKLVGDDHAPTNKQYPSYSTSYRRFQDGRRSYVDEHSEAPPDKSTLQSEGTEANMMSNDDIGTPLVLDYMGGVDARVGGGMVVDGDEFFDADDLVSDSNHVDSSSEGLFDDAKIAESCYIEQSKAKSIMTDEIDKSRSIVYESSAIMYANGDANSSEQAELSDDEKDIGASGAVMLEETPLPRMFVPGKIVHIYSHRGVYKAAFVPRAFCEIRRISMAGNMLTDHKTKSYYDALLEVRTVRRAPESPPRWTAFDEDDTCSCCASKFTWASTSDSEAQEARDKHNCRSCGALVCHPCSENWIPVPSIGLTVPARICDRCYNDIDGLHLSNNPEGANNGIDEADQSTNEESKPTRSRERRSPVVDDLASRVHSTPYHL